MPVKFFFLPYSYPPQADWIVHSQITPISMPEKAVISIHSDGKRAVTVVTSDSEATAFTLMSIIPGSSAIPFDQVRKYSSIKPLDDAWKAYTGSYTSIWERKIDYWYRIKAQMPLDIYPNPADEKGANTSAFFTTIMRSLVASGGGIIHIVVQPSKKAYKTVEHLYTKGAAKARSSGDPRSRLKAELLQRKISSSLFEVSIYVLGHESVAHAVLSLKPLIGSLRIERSGGLLKMLEKAKRRGSVMEFDKNFHVNYRGSLVMSSRELTNVLPLVPYDDKLLVRMPAPAREIPDKPNGTIHLCTTIDRRGKVKEVKIAPYDFAIGGIIAGLPGSGKSVIAANYTLDLFASGAHVLVIDPKNSFADLLLAAFPKKFPDLKPEDHLIYLPSDLFPANFNFFDATKEDNLDEKIAYWSDELADIFGVRELQAEKRDLYKAIIRTALRLIHEYHEHPNLIDFVDAVKAICDPSVDIQTHNKQLERMISEIRARWSEPDLDKAREAAKKDVSNLINLMEKLLDNKQAIWSFVSRNPITLDEVFPEEGEGPNRILVVRLNPGIPPETLALIARLFFAMGFRFARKRSNRTTEEQRKRRPVVFMIDEARHIVNFLYERVGDMVQEGRSLGMWLVAIVQTFWQVREQSAEAGGEKIRASLYGTVGLNVIFNQKNVPPDVPLPGELKYHLDGRLPRYWAAFVVPYSDIEGRSLIIYGQAPPYPDRDERFILPPSIKNVAEYSDRLKEFMRNIKRRWGASEKIIDLYFKKRRVGGITVGSVLSEADIAKLLAEKIIERRKKGKKVVIAMDRTNVERIRRFMEDVSTALGVKWDIEVVVGQSE